MEAVKGRGGGCTAWGIGVHSVEAAREQAAGRADVSKGVPVSYAVAYLSRFRRSPTCNAINTMSLLVL